MRIQDDLESAYEPETGTGCWLWTRALNSAGYGILHVDGTLMLAHRHMHETFVGPIPEGMHVLHKCDIRRCVNPAHFFLGTNDDNIADMIAKGRQNKGENHGRSKLCEAQITAIRADPRPQRVIAEAHEISKSHVSDIKRRKYWAHVPEATL